MERTKKRLAFRLLAPAMLTLMLVGATGVQDASAHAQGGWVGPHALKTPGAYCYNDANFTTAYVNPPTIFATPYDRYTYQVVAYRARLVAYSPVTGSQETVANSAWKSALAYDNQAARFPGGQLELSGIRLGKLKPFTQFSEEWHYFVAVELAFGSTSDGVTWDWLPGGTHWVDSYVFATSTRSYGSAFCG